MIYLPNQNPGRVRNIVEPGKFSWRVLDRKSIATKSQPDLDSLRTKFSTSKAGSLRSRLQDHGPQHDGASITKARILVASAESVTDLSSLEDPLDFPISEVATGEWVRDIQEILPICPQFRILLIGKTGVGKSSLINEVFGFNDENVSDFAPGQAEIDREIFSESNPRLVFHDSRGFEPGETRSFETVRDFVWARNRMPELKNKLHAIWLCMAIPVAGSRILEIGVEELLRLKIKGSLGDAPIIAIFTKFDQLVDREDRKLASPEYDDLDDEKLSELARKNAQQAFEDECAKPFRALLGDLIPLKMVSIQEKYKTTLEDLVYTTSESVSCHIAPEVSIVFESAQRWSTTFKIKECVTIGKLWYWKGLSSSIKVPGKTLALCLEKIHPDIVDIWNINDPCKNLQSTDFKAMMSKLVSESIYSDSVGGLVFVKRRNLECFMAYIVDLTLVMRNIFWIVKGKRQASRRLIKLAFRAYFASDIRKMVHNSITKHVEQETLFSSKGSETILDTIADLIHQYTTNYDEFFELQDIMSCDVEGADEPWD